MKVERLAKPGLLIVEYDGREGRMAVEGADGLKAEIGLVRDQGVRLVVTIPVEARYEMVSWHVLNNPEPASIEHLRALVQLSPDEALAVSEAPTSRQVS